MPKVEHSKLARTYQLLSKLEPFEYKLLRQILDGSTTIKRPGKRVILLFDQLWLARSESKDFNAFRRELTVENPRDIEYDSDQLLDWLMRGLSRLQFEMEGQETVQRYLLFKFMSKRGVENQFRKYWTNPAKLVDLEQQMLSLLQDRMSYQSASIRKRDDAIQIMNSFPEEFFQFVLREIMLQLCLQNARTDPIDEKRLRHDFPLGASILEQIKIRDAPEKLAAATRFFYKIYRIQMSAKQLDTIESPTERLDAIESAAAFFREFKTVFSSFEKKSAIRLLMGAYAALFNRFSNLEIGKKYLELVDKAMEDELLLESGKLSVNLFFNIARLKYALEGKHRLMTFLKLYEGRVGDPEQARSIHAHFKAHLDEKPLDPSIKLDDIHHRTYFSRILSAQLLFERREWKRLEFNKDTFRQDLKRHQSDFAQPNSYEAFKNFHHFLSQLEQIYRKKKDMGKRELEDRLKTIKADLMKEEFVSERSWLLKQTEM